MLSLRAFAIACVLAAGWAAACVAQSQEQARNLEIAPSTGPLAGARIYGNSFALLIGVNEYPGLPRSLWLRYAVKDVEDLRLTLVKSYGFPEGNVKVLLDRDATIANIRTALGSMADSGRIKPEDRVFVYFSGHGQTVKLPTGGDMGFLLPSDAEVDLANPTNAGPYLTSCLPMDAIWNYLASSPAKHSLLIADACYSGLLTTRSRGLEALSEPALMALAAKRALQVITAGSGGEKSVENDQWGHGAFTFKLLEELNARTATPDSVFTASELHAALERSVANLTTGKQTPLMGNKDTEGQFLFIPVLGAAAGSAPTPITAAEVRTSLLSASSTGLKAMLALRPEQVDALESVRSRYHEELRGLRLRRDDPEARGKVDALKTKYEAEALGILDPAQKTALPGVLADMSMLIRASIPASLIGELNLTADQKARIAAIVQKLDERWRNLPLAERSTRSREFRDEARTGTRPILTADQIAKLDDYQSAKSRVRDDMTHSSAAVDILLYSPRAISGALKLSSAQTSNLISLQRGLSSRSQRQAAGSLRPDAPGREQSRDEAARALQRILTPAQWDELPVAQGHLRTLSVLNLPVDAIAALNLTSAQWTRLQELERSLNSALRALSPAESKSRFAELRQESGARAMEVLSPEQQENARRYRSTRRRPTSGVPPQ